MQGTYPAEGKTALLIPEKEKNNAAFTILIPDKRYLFIRVKNSGFHSLLNCTHFSLPVPAIPGFRRLEPVALVPIVWSLTRCVNAGFVLSKESASNSYPCPLQSPETHKQYRY
jgi:hypothetical protein